MIDHILILSERYLQSIHFKGEENHQDDAGFFSSSSAGKSGLIGAQWSPGEESYCLQSKVCSGFLY